MANYTEGAPQTANTTIVGASRAETSSGKPFVKATCSNGVELQTWEKALGDFLIEGNTTPTNLTYVLRQSEYNGQTYTNAILKEIDGFTRPEKKAWGGGGGGRDPVFDSRSYAVSYVKDIVVAAINAGTIKIKAESIESIDEMIIPVADRLAGYIKDGATGVKIAGEQARIQEIKNQTKALFTEVKDEDAPPPPMYE